LYNSQNAKIAFIYCSANFTPKALPFTSSDKMLIDLIFDMLLRVGTTELQGDAPWLLTEPMIFAGTLEMHWEDRSQGSLVTGLQMPSLFIRDRNVPWCIPKITAAPFAPSIRQNVCLSTRITWRRWTSSRSAGASATSGARNGSMVGLFRGHLFISSKRLGHASIQTSAIYVHATDRGKRWAISALERYADNFGQKLVKNEKEQIE
jgi:hypothetical protein